jgi:hypothetical protein
MSELDELTHGKTLEELEGLKTFQLLMGETPGGTIVSHIQAEIDKLKK